MLAQMYGLAKMKKGIQLEKVANEYFHFFKKNPNLISKHEASSFNVTVKVTKGTEFVPLFKQNARSNPEFDSECNYCRAIPAAVILKEASEYILLDCELSHVHSANVQAFEWLISALAYPFHGMKEKSSLNAELSKENSFSQMIQLIELIEGPGDFLAIATTIRDSKMLPGAKICAAALLGAKLGFRAIHSQLISNLLSSKGESKLSLRHLIQQGLIARFFDK